MFRPHQDIFLYRPVKADIIGTETGYPHHQVAVRVGVFHRVPQNIPRDGIDLYLLSAFEKIRADQSGQTCAFFRVSKHRRTVFLVDDRTGTSKSIIGLGRERNVVVGPSLSRRAWGKPRRSTAFRSGVRQGWRQPPVRPRCSAHSRQWQDIPRRRPLFCIVRRYGHGFWINHTAYLSTDRGYCHI